jgi:hypothetical protein
MESYLKGRSKTQKFTALIPSQNNPSALAQGREEEATVRATPAPDVTNAPDVDLVMQNGIVKKIVIHMPDGNVLELECEYEEESDRK